MVGQITGASLNLAAPDVKPKDTSKKIEDAAEQFEALLMGQLLKTAREAGSSGWMGTGDDQAGQIGMEMAEQALARSMSSHGGLGLSGMIAQGLKRQP